MILSPNDHIQRSSKRNPKSHFSPASQVEVTPAHAGTVLTFSMDISGKVLLLRLFSKLYGHLRELLL